MGRKNTTTEEASANNVFWERRGTDLAYLVAPEPG